MGWLNFRQAGLAETWFGSQLEIIADFESSETGLSGEPNWAILAAQALLKFAQPRFGVVKAATA
jgi:hypothetical protein